MFNKDLINHSVRSNLPSDKCRYSYKLDDRDDQTAIREHKPVQQALTAHRMRTLQKPPSLLTHLYGRDQRVDLVKPDVDAATTPNNTTVMRRPSSRVCRQDPAAPCCRETRRRRCGRCHTTQPPDKRLLQNDAPGGRTALSITIIRSGRPRSRVFLGIA